MRVPGNQPQSAGRIAVSFIETPDGFEALHAEWDALYRSDPDACVFLARDWLAHGIAQEPNRWAMLVGRDAETGALLGALPLRYRVHWSRSQSRLHTEIEAGTRLLGGLYSGALCRPEAEEAVMAAFGAYLATLPWARLSFRYAAPSRRFDPLARSLETAGDTVRWSGLASDDDAEVEPRHSALKRPFLTLPESMGAFCEEQVPGEVTRRYRAWRSGEDLADLTVSIVEAETLEATLGLFDTESGGSGSESSGGGAARHLPAFAAALSCERLFFPLLCRGETVLCGLAHMLDPEHGDVVRLAAFGRTDAALDLLTLFSVEWAIQQDFLCYDLGGEAPGVTFRQPFETMDTTHLSVRRGSGAEAPILDPLNTGAALQRLAGYLERGRQDDALTICRQLIDLYT